jgi:hypothetical protein
MPLSLEQIDRELAELEKRYKQDRDDLLRMRAYVLRHSAPEQPVLLTPPPSDWTPMSGKIPPTRSGVRTDRQIIREFLAGWTGDFTIQQLMDAAQRHEGSPAAAFDKNLWSATIFWLCQNRFLDVVKPRQGNKPGTYRIIVSRAELVAPKRRKNKSQSPLQNAVIEAIKMVDKDKFTKNDVVKIVQQNDPTRKEDVIGAVLHRLAANNIGARIFARSNSGNVYAKL